MRAATLAPEAPRGTILKIERGMATVRLDATGGGCGGCARGEGCGIERWGAMKRRAVELTLEAPTGLGVGARVAFVLPEASVFRLALLGYGFPVLSALLGASIGQGVFGGDGAAALFALGAFVGALFLARPVARRLFRVVDGPGGGALVPLSPPCATAPGQQEMGDRLPGRAV